MKAVPLAAVLAVAFAGMAQAENTFSLPQVMMTDALVVLPLINSDADGVVEIYDYNTHEIGSLLGSMDVKAGVNEDVRIGIHGMPFNDVIAVLKIGGETVAQQLVEFSENR